VRLGGSIARRSVRQTGRIQRAELLKVSQINDAGYLPFFDVIIDEGVCDRSPPLPKKAWTASTSLFRIIITRDLLKPRMKGANSKSA
jgi:hypothetical protein